MYITITRSGGPTKPQTQTLVVDTNTLTTAQREGIKAQLARFPHDEQKVVPPVQYNDAYQYDVVVEEDGKERREWTFTGFPEDHPEHHSRSLFDTLKGCGMRKDVLDQQQKDQVEADKAQPEAERKQADRSVREVATGADEGHAR